MAQTIDHIQRVLKEAREEGATSTADPTHPEALKEQLETTPVVKPVTIDTTGDTAAARELSDAMIRIQEQEVL